MYNLRKSRWREVVSVDYAEKVKGYMTLAEMAELLSVSQPTLRQQIAKGVLTAEKMGRDWIVSDEDFETYKRERWGKRGVASPDHPLHKKGGDA